MLGLFCIHLIILTSCVAAGFLCYEATGTGRSVPRPLISLFITGLVCLTMMGQVIVLFFPVNAAVQSIFACLLLAGIAWKRKAFLVLAQSARLFISKVKPATWIAVASAWLLVLLIGAGYTISDDTDSYHIPMVKWITDYGTVPGIANLHSRYGFNSSWFVSIALLTPRGLQGQFYTALNSLVSVLLVIYLAGKLKHALLAIPAGFVLVTALTAWPVIRGNSASAGYDVITTLVVLVLFVECLSCFLPASGRRPERAGQGFPPAPSGEGLPVTALILWPVYLLSIRITNFPLLLLSIGGCIHLFRSNKKQLWLMAGCCAFLIIPFLARNVMVSGYPFYPSRAFDVFGVDWKADPARTEQLMNFIRNFNRVRTDLPPYKDVPALSFPQWVPQWFNEMFSYNKRIFLIGIGGIFSALVMFVKKAPLAHPQYRLFVVTLFLQLLFWFFLAPDPRFVYGPLLCGCFLIALFLVPRPVRLTRHLPLILAGISMGLLGYTMYLRRAQVPAFCVLPFELPKPPLTTTYINSIPVSIPSPILNNFNSRCYDTGLPCTYEIYPGLEARGKNIRDGFRLSEKRDRSKPSGL